MDKNTNMMNLWLSYVNNIPNIKSLIGNNTNDIIDKSNMYDYLNNNCIYYVEMPLCGKSGVDLSLQYNAIDFINKKYTFHNDIEIYGEYFNKYIDLLSKYNMDLEEISLFLESDISSGNGDKYSIFFRLPYNEEYIDDILINLLEIVSLPEYAKVLLYTNDIVHGMLIPKQIGFMYSRDNFSIRLVYIPINNKVTHIFHNLSKIKFGDKIPRDDLFYMYRSMNFSFFSIMFNIDIMDNKTIGDKFGFEFSLNSPTIEYQKRFFNKMIMDDVINLMIDLGISDNRIKLVKDCIFDTNIKNNSDTFRLMSKFSHFKVIWENKKRLLSKAYVIVEDNDDV